MTYPIDGGTSVYNSKILYKQQQQRNKNKNLGPKTKQRVRPHTTTIVLGDIGV